MKFLENSHKSNRWLILLIYSVLATAVLGLLALPAKAECTYEGQTYQTGDRVGPYVCMPDGTWQPQ